MPVVFRFCLLLLLGFSASGFAHDDTNTQQLHQTQAQIQQLEQHIQLNKEQEQALVKQLATIEKKYGTVAAALTHLANQIQSQRQRLSALGKTIKTQQQQVREQSQGLLSQIKSAYVMGRQERLKLLLNQQDPARSSRLLAYYDYFNKARIKRREQLNQSVARLLQSQQQQRQVEQKLQTLLADKQTERQALATASAERQRLLEQLATDIDDQHSVLAQLKENERALIKILQQGAEQAGSKALVAKAFKPLKGRLHWPIAGKITKRFGSRRGNGRWDGVLIAAKEGHAIKAISSGRVIFADWLRGYGLLMIIDHGDDYMSLYAFARSLEKNTGDTVAGGEVIAAVGKTDGRSRAGLYFGLRKKGKAIDPAKWCKKVSNGRTS